ncbi:MAG: hypothetical protein U5J62_06330 [Desulfurivibrio sp.]|nr:hypothetical protein [Desulfurivibrio sp.]
MGTHPSCFKSYDIRGRVPDELNADIAYRVGRAYAATLALRGPVVVGRDIRLSSPALAAAPIAGLNDAGVDTFDIGLCGTEMVYLAAARPGVVGGIMVTASHNPVDYNGMKLVREQARPISGDSGLKRIADLVAASRFPLQLVLEAPINPWMSLTNTSLKYCPLSTGRFWRPCIWVVNAGNGCAGPDF